jgi:Flp pilus assembly protein TadG
MPYRYSKNSDSRREQQGAIIFLVLVSLIGMIGLLALALDIGESMRLQAKLQTIYDAAALRAAKALHAGESELSAESAAREIIAANLIASGFSSDIINDVDHATNIVFPEDTQKVRIDGYISHQNWFTGIWSGGPTYMEPTAVAVSQYSHERAQSAPSSIAFVLDNSSSMLSENKLADLKAVLTELFDIKDENDKVYIDGQHEISLYNYDRDVHNMLNQDWIPLGEAGNRQYILDQIDGLHNITTGTNIPKATRKVYEIIPEAEFKKNVNVVFLTDGKPTRDLYMGDVQDYTAEDKIYRCTLATDKYDRYEGESIAGADQIRKPIIEDPENPEAEPEPYDYGENGGEVDTLEGRGATLSTIGFGTSYIDENLMRRMAGEGVYNGVPCNENDSDLNRYGPKGPEDNKGIYRRATDADELLKAFKEILAETMGHELIGLTSDCSSS